MKKVLLLALVGVTFAMSEIVVVGMDTLDEEFTKCNTEVLTHGKNVKSNLDVCTKYYFAKKDLNAEIMKLTSNYVLEQDVSKLPKLINSYNDSKKLKADMLKKINKKEKK